MKMRHNRADAGFTLMELVTVMVAASIVTLAATTMMLFAMRVNGRTTSTVRQQSNSDVLMTTLENLSTKGTINKIVTDVDNNNTPNNPEDDVNYWEIIDKSGAVLYSYVAETATLYSGERPDNDRNNPAGTVLLEGVISFYADLSDDGVLTFSMETEKETYSSAVYCRLGGVKVEQGDEVIGELDDTITQAGTTQDTGNARMSYLRVLANQYKLAGGRVNNGLILNADKTSTGKYYSEWYIGDYALNPGWNAQTPWCACFLSWGLNVCKEIVNTDSIPRAKWYASVDDYAAYFKAGAKKADGTGHYWLDNLEFSQVRPGDLIVFDWNLDNDPSHIGAVLMVNIDEGRVYTIEGNTSNRVGVRSYKLSDPRILGYGVIDWTVTGS